MHLCVGLFILFDLVFCITALVVYDPGVHTYAFMPCCLDPQQHRVRNPGDWRFYGGVIAFCTYNFLAIFAYLFLWVMYIVTQFDPMVARSTVDRFRRHLNDQSLFWLALAAIVYMMMGTSVLIVQSPKQVYNATVDEWQGVPMPEAAMIRFVINAVSFSFVTAYLILYGVIVADRSARLNTDWQELVAGDAGGFCRAVLNPMIFFFIAFLVTGVYILVAFTPKSKTVASVLPFVLLIFIYGIGSASILVFFTSRCCSLVPKSTKVEAPEA